MRPDQIPVRPLSSRATLSPADARELFGTDRLKGRETVEVIRLGTAVGSVPVSVADETCLLVDSLLSQTGTTRLAGPLGTVSVRTGAVASRLLVPAALRRAWGLDEEAPVMVGCVALSLPVHEGDLAAEIDQALWLGAGRPETARWVAGLALPSSSREVEVQDEGVIEIPRRVVTETDVRQAVLKRKRIRLREGQIVTPAARAMGREHQGFER